MSSATKVNRGDVVLLPIAFVSGPDALMLQLENCVKAALCFS
jgi:hypothetical protein